MAEENISFAGCHYHEEHRRKQKERPPLVLLADDDDEFRALVRQALEQEGLRVVDVPDGESFVRYFEAPTGDDLAPSVVVTDYCMPGYSGVDVLDAMQRAGSKTPVILITAFGDRELHATAEAMGAAAVIDKPFDIEELKTAVLLCLDWSVTRLH